jgi:hypothetical protein
MRHFANHMFKLNGRMVDVKILAEPLFYVAQNPLAG